MSHLVCLCLATFVQNAQADSGAYLGLNAAGAEHSSTWMGDQSVTTMSAVAGVELNKNLSIEARVGTGIDSAQFVDETSIATFYFDVELDRVVGAYVKAGVPISERVGLYGIAGMTQGKVKIDWKGFGPVSDVDSGFSYGIGSELDVSERARFNLEWMMLFEGDWYEVSGLSLGVSFLL